MTVPNPEFETSATPPAGAESVTPDGEKGISQGRLILRRFMSHKIALVSIALFLAIVAFAITATGFGDIPGWWKWDHKQLIPPANGGRPTLSLIPEWLGGEGIKLGDHPFGQSTVGKDYFAMVMRGIVNSSYIMFIIGLIGTAVGVVIGAIAGYYRGWVDAILMRITDVVIVIPIIVIGAVVGSAVGGLGPLLLAVMLGFFAWTGIARLVRAEFLSLREREFVEAARVAGASDLRIIFKHILPNAIGVVIVAATLLIAAAIILETSLSFLGFGVRLPEVSLGRLISDNESAFQTRPYLFWWPAVFIVVLGLLVNFVGDGLRDAFDPRQKRVIFRRVRELPSNAEVTATAGVVSDAPGEPEDSGIPGAGPRREPPG
ncbi:MAG: ABC transporter permease [Microbacterium sp.]|uniref:ABC transporter permease n=1 Tax=Microbacterium sp. TaxID=51671 RepID=UPI003A867057